MGRVKGSAIRAVVDWYVAGGAAVEQLYSDVREGIRAQLVLGRPYLGILPSSWYDDSVIHAMCDAFVGSMSKTIAHSSAAAGGRAAIHTAMSGVHRAMFRVFVSPALYAAHSQRLWNGYYDNGVYAVREVAPREHEVAIARWSSHHPLLCASLRGSTTVIYESMGCRAVRVDRSACVSNADPACRLEVRWA